MKMSTPSQLAESASHTAGHAAEQVDHAAHEACDHLADKAHQAVDAAKPVVDRWARDAESAARRGMDAARDTTRELRDRFSQASDTAAQYVKDEPVKAMLIAAAAGAALVAALSMLNRSNRRY